MKSLHISLEDIESATEEFSQKNCFASGTHWEAYKGELQLPHASVNTAIVAKRWDSKFDDQFRTELDILFQRNHKNIIHLIGYCDEKNVRIIVYEYMSKGSLDKCLKDPNLRWIKRLGICIGVASALEFLHGGDVTLKKVVHRGIKSHGILLNDNWDAQISNFELSSLDSSHQDMEHISDDAYLDPHHKPGPLTEKSDIYSFGVILFEILCGRLAWVEGCEDNSQSLDHLVAKEYYKQGELDEMVFEDIKTQIVPQSLSTFVDIACRCLHEDDNMRPKASEVVMELKKALEFQEEYEIWEPKLPRDYKEILPLSETPEICRLKEIYNKLSNGIHLLKKTLWFKLSNSGKANKMISARMFSYEDLESHQWRSIHKSRFRTAAKMLDISKLKIRIEINTQFLSPDVTYGVYLVFKFCEPRINSCKSKYMNLKYIYDTKTLNSYFATRRDDGWMMIELHRFLKKEDNTFKFLLESFSRYYSGSDTIYIDGIEFLAIENVAHEDSKKLKKVPKVVQKSFSDLDEKKFDQWKVDGEIHLMLSAMEVLYHSPKQQNPFRFKPSTNSRFQNVAKLLPQQVFRIKYKIETQMLSPYTDYTCYLVFKVSEKCRGLHCPVKVRDLLHRKNKENKIIYFRSPAPWNQHGDFCVPEKREDGWMEVMLWKLKSKDEKLGKNNYITMNLKLTTYEGTMSGLTICGLDFRPDQP